MFRLAGEEHSVLVICGTVFVMQQAATALNLPLPEVDPVETNEGRMPRMR